MNAPRWMKTWLRAAAIYNVAWGAWVVLLPNSYFAWLGMDAPRYPELWQGIGMIVGVYGLGYWVAAGDPFRHWPIVLVGFLGKVFGPIGFAQAILKGSLPLAFGTTLITNDLVWWIPFALILWRAFEASGRPETDLSLARLDAGELMRTLRSSHGRTVYEHTVDAPHLVVFLRHFGCTFCREALEDLAENREAIESDGARLLVVHMGSPKQGEQVLHAAGLEGVAHVSDPSTALYRAFGLRRGTFRQLFGLRSWTRGFAARKHGVGALVGDGFQMPGVFLVESGEVLKAHRHANASEVPDYDELASCPVPASR